MSPEDRASLWEALALAVQAAAILSVIVSLLAVLEWVVPS